MREVAAEKVRGFLLTKYAGAMTAMGIDPAQVDDKFDFLVSGVVDSFGILDMVAAIEDEFGIQLDMENLDAEQITVLGPLSQFIANYAIGT